MQIEDVGAICDAAIEFIHADWGYLTHCDLSNSWHSDPVSQKLKALYLLVKEHHRKLTAADVIRNAGETRF
jgi:hypothetical protein